VAPQPCRSAAEARAWRGPCQHIGPLDVDLCVDKVGRRDRARGSRPAIGPTPRHSRTSLEAPSPLRRETSLLLCLGRDGSFDEALGRAAHEGFSKTIFDNGHYRKFADGRPMRGADGCCQNDLEGPALGTQHCRRRRRQPLALPALSEAKGLNGNIQGINWMIFSPSSDLAITSNFFILRGPSASKGATNTKNPVFLDPPTGTVILS